MLKKKFLTAIMIAAMCITTLVSCGGGSAATTESESKPPISNKKITERGDGSFANEGKNGVEEGIDNIRNGIERGMDDMMDNAEDATHGTARQDGRDNDTEAETDAPMREHRPAAPKGK